MQTRRAPAAFTDRGSLELGISAENRTVGKTVAEDPEAIAKQTQAHLDFLSSLHASMEDTLMEVSRQACVKARRNRRHSLS